MQCDVNGSLVYNGCLNKVAHSKVPLKLKLRAQKYAYRRRTGFETLLKRIFFNTGISEHHFKNVRTRECTMQLYEEFCTLTTISAYKVIFKTSFKYTKLS